MILRDAIVDQELYLTANRELVAEKREKILETLFAEEYRKAKERGELSGEKQGYEKASQETASLVALLQRLSERLLEQKKRLFEQMKPELIELSLLIAERVIRQELKNKESMQAMVDSLLDQAMNAFSDEKLKVFLAPADWEALGSRQLQSVSFLADPTLSQGDCRIEAKSGLLNATLSHILEDLKC